MRDLLRFITSKENRCLHPSDFSWDLPTMGLCNPFSFPLQWPICLYTEINMRFKSLPKEQIGRLHDFFQAGFTDVWGKKKKILSFEVWICLLMEDVAPYIVTPGWSDRSRRWEVAVGGCWAASPSTLQSTWLWPALLGPFCWLTLPNLV